MPIHAIVDGIGSERASGLLYFHAVTGCDVVSAFRGKGKKSAWHTWNIFPEITPVFEKLSMHPMILDENDFNMIQKFVVMLYDKNIQIDNVMI